MSGWKSFADNESGTDELTLDGEDKLLLIDDAQLVSAFAAAGQRRGAKLICVQCFNPARSLRALLLLLDEAEPAESPVRSVGFCGDCYRDLGERMFHDAVLRASKLSDSLIRREGH
jgi:hypothetical protein